MFEAEWLENGWRLLTNCRLGGNTIQIVLIRPAAGVALIEIEPVWTPDALDLFGALLAEADFSRRFPGHLPVIHRRMRQVDVPMLAMLLADAFLWLEPISLDLDEPWEGEIEALLKASTDAHGTIVHAPADSRATSLGVATNGASARPGTPSSARKTRWRAEAWAALAAAGLTGAAYLFLVPMTADPAAPSGVVPPRSVGMVQEAAPTTSAPAGMATRGTDPPSVADAPRSTEFFPPGTPSGPAERAPDGPAAPAISPVAQTPNDQSWAPAQPEPMAPMTEPPPDAPSAAQPPGEPMETRQSAADPDAALGSSMPEEVSLQGEPFWAMASAIPAPNSAPVVGTDAAPAPTPLDVAPASEPTQPPPAPAPMPATVVLGVPPALSAADIEAARRRGEALASVGDISGARRFLERAARAGSGAAAMAMAESFDPHVLARRGVIGMRPDTDAARLWYREALMLGVVEAAARLNLLEAER